MFLTKFIFNKFLILIFLLFRCCPSGAFCFPIMMVRIINELSFSFYNFESKISSFLSWYWFKEVILVLFFRLSTSRWFISFWLVIIWSTVVIKILITKFCWSRVVWSCGCFNFHIYLGFLYVWSLLNKINLIKIIILIKKLRYTHLHISIF